MELLATLEDKYRLPRGLLGSVMQAESGGNVNAVSPKGAQGAFQFMPATARQYGVNTKDLASSAEGAAKMYADLLKLHNGDLDKALASYNWGQGKVARKGLENAPKETRDYIAKVKTGMGGGDMAKNEEWVETDVPANIAKSDEEWVETDVPANIAKRASKQQSKSETSYTVNPSVDNIIPNAKALGGYIGDTLSNIPSSAVKFGEGIIQSFNHPVETASGLGNLAAGAIEKGLPYAHPALLPMRPLIREGVRQIPGYESHQATADAVGDFYKTRYGSLGQVADTLKTDPVGTASDLSVLLGGAGALAKGTGAGAMLQKASNFTNPLSIVKPTVKLAAKGVSELAGLGTFTGGKPLEIAAKSGFEGGKTAKTFRANMYGKTPMTDVLDDAKSGLNSMRNDLSKQYRSGMFDISKDKSVLSFNGIDDAINQADEIGRFKGQVKNQSVVDVQQRIAKEVSDWKALNPREYHTPEGIDALKQKVGGILETIDPVKDRSAYKAASSIYNSIKSEISTQAPTYAKVMKDYADGMDEISEIEKTLVGGRKASSDTSLRKLQSIMRNNANTNYGRRNELASVLQNKGGKDIETALAGQSLNSLTSRGLGKALMTGSAGAAILNPELWPLLALQSPLLMGSLFHGAGYLGRGANALIPSKDAAMAMYQAGRLPIYPENKE